MRNLIQRIRRAHVVRHWVEYSTHTGYCIAVGIEGHGFYASLGLILGVVLIINGIVGDAE